MLYPVLELVIDLIHSVMRVYNISLKSDETSQANVSADT